MDTAVLASGGEMGRMAALKAASVILQAIETKGCASIVLPTGASQFEVYRYLVTMPIRWPNVVMFHLDEYIGLDASHPASFRGYLKKHFLDKVSPLKEVHLIHGDADDPAKECQRLNALIAGHEIDLVLAGIGENGHLAFNDPPADFNAADPYLVVRLDDACRRQQYGEGWFPSFETVPERAISMSVHQIMKSNCLILSVPDERKAHATQQALQGEISPVCPASIVRNHPNCHVYLDQKAASLLKR